MIRVGERAVAANARQHARSAFPRALDTLQDQDRRTVAHHESVAVDVERSRRAPASVLRESAPARTRLSYTSGLKQRFAASHDCGVDLASLDHPRCQTDRVQR